MVIDGHLWTGASVYCSEVSFLPVYKQLNSGGPGLPPAPYIPCVYNDVHFELELSGQLTDAGCPEKGWCAPPHQQKDQSVIYYP